MEAEGEIHMGEWKGPAACEWREFITYHTYNAFINSIVSMEAEGEHYVQ